MDDKINTLRITKFKGLNKSVNPHNIDDAEFPDMINAELTSNRTIQSRKGYVKLADNIDSRSIKALYKAVWSDTDSRLYYGDSMRLCKVDETAKMSTFLSLAMSGGYNPMFQRYKDRMLLLLPGQELKWFTSSESLAPVEMPELSVGSGWTTYVSASAGGSLAESTTYQYAISLLLGSEREDGETSLSLPGEEIVFPGPGDTVGVVWPSAHTFATTTAANKTLASTAGISYTGVMHSFVPYSIRLFRREVKLNTYTRGGTTYLECGAEESPWEWLDEAYLETADLGATYTIRATNYGVITDTSTITVASDIITIALIFSDDGTSTVNTGYQPRESVYTVSPKARYMARMNNRIILANIESTQAIDKKSVYFSYRPLGTNDVQSEIPDFYYENPMLVFPIYNQFYCDLEDIEDEITGLATYQDNLIIFTSRCMFLWRDTSPKMADPIKISDDIGCISNRTICEFEGKLIWLTTNGIYTFDGSKVTNISRDKVDPYIKSLSKEYASRACATIYGRRYFIAAPFAGGAVNDAVLVYDFDLDEWHERQYEYDANYGLNLTSLYTYCEGSQETLYGAGTPDGGAGSAGYSKVVRLEDGYRDNSSNVVMTLKTKYYDLQAPDAIKRLRNFYLDTENYSTGLTIDIYTDNLNAPVDTFTVTGSDTGFVVNSSGGLGNVNEDYIVNAEDKMFGFSLNSGISGERFQFGVKLTASTVPVKVHAVGIDWRLRRRVQRKYGG